jgi:hypothetical protein
VIHIEEENERNNAALETLHDKGRLAPMEELENTHVASEVLRGEWDLSNAHIQELAARFRLTPELFLPKASPTTAS